MAGKTEPATLPPPGAGACWATFLKWALGVPALVAVALGVIWLAWWAAGSFGLMPRTEAEIGGILLWLGLIVLLYPVALVVLVLDLRDGLRAARSWAALSEEARQAALAAQAEAPPDPPRGKRRRR